MKTLSGILPQRKCASLMTSVSSGSKIKLETEGTSKCENRGPSTRFLTPKSESYVYENLKLKKNSLPCGEFDNKKQLIPMPETPNQPKEVLRKSLASLKSYHWTESVNGLKDIVQISRTTAIRTACQAANEIFTNMPPSEGPELENLACLLLEKTTNETNPLIKEDASEALDTLLIRIPPISVARILLNKRIMSMSESARITATKLLVCAVHSLGMGSGSAITKDLKTSLVNATVNLLQDDCFEIKVHGMNLVTMLMQNEDFTNIFQTKFSNPRTKKVTKLGANVEMNKP